MKLSCSVDSHVAWPQTPTFFIPSYAPNVLFLRASVPAWWIPSRSACLMLEIMLVLFLSLTCPGARAAEPGGVRGVITDPTGAVIRGATVDLLQGSTRIASTTTGAEGAFQLTAPRAGHYSIRAAAEGFTAQQSGLVYVGTGRTVLQNLTLALGTVSQHVVVTATGVPVPESQVGAAVSVITADQFQEKLQALEPMRQVPGVEVLAHGQRGISSSLFIRGGESNHNKVLLDGIPINEIGGVVDFGAVLTTGIEREELLRGANSVLYGADALAGVLSLTTSRGTTPLPRLGYAFDGGNFRSLHQDASLGGAFGQFDYFSDFSRVDSANSEPNSTFHNATYAGNLGWTPSGSTDVRLTARRVAATVGEPNAIDFFGIPDDSFLAQHNTYLSATIQNQTTSEWHNLIRYGATRLDALNVSPTPAGIFDPASGNFLGKVVTIRGANGFSATGQAILDFAGTPFPLTTPILTNRDFVDAQSDYAFNSHLTALFGFRFENERVAPIERNNFSYTGEMHGNLWNRLYGTAGFGVENNAVFGVAATPRVSLAYYLLRPQSGGRFNGTKLKFNYGQGIKEVDLFSQQTSLFDLLSQQAGGAQAVSQFHIAPIGPERSRTFDFGLEQFAWNGRARLGVTFFHNRFTDLIEFISDPTALEKLGVPPQVAIQITSGPSGGASLNSLATRALGAETEIEFLLGHGFSVRAAYTYLDAVVERSFSTDALGPSFNPAFPTIPIGAFSPLVGNRPFNRAPHVGSFYLGYAKPRFTVALSGNLVSRRDGSTFLLDSQFGPSMLLPNRNLQQGYQKLDLSGSYQIQRHWELYSLVENLASQRYAPVIGFPALPLNFRAGVRFTVGGESWR